MSKAPLFAFLVPPTRDNPTLAYGRVLATGEVFRFSFEKSVAWLMIYPNDYMANASATQYERSLLSDCEAGSPLLEIATKYPRDQRFLSYEGTLGLGSADGRAGRTLINGLLTHWVSHYILTKGAGRASAPTLSTALMASVADEYQRLGAEARRDFDNYARRAIAALPKILRDAIDHNRQAVLYELCKCSWTPAEEGGVPWGNFRQLGFWYGSTFFAPKKMQLEWLTPSARKFYDQCVELGLDPQFLPMERQGHWCKIVSGLSPEQLKEKLQESLSASTS